MLELNCVHSCVNFISCNKITRFIERDDFGAHRDTPHQRLYTGPTWNFQKYCDLICSASLVVQHDRRFTTFLEDKIF